jgi:hypothetical protein
MKTKIISGLAAFLIVLTFNSCSKKKGCMDKDSTNFDSSAQQDDGSCQYKGNVVLWMQNALPPGYSVNTYIDGAFQGNVNVTFANAPGCGTTGALTINKNLGSAKNKNCTLRMDVDSSGFATTPPTSTSATITFTANTCTSYKMN